MEKIIIEGGHALKGELKISGSKNSALPCLFATLLTDEKIELENVPNLVDIETAFSLLTHLGKKIRRYGSKVIVTSGKNLATDAPYDLVRKMRASILVLGPLLAREGRASASLPGGCAIGVRPINIHLSGFEALGAKSDMLGGIVHLSAKKLEGRRIKFSVPSVGATENLLMASVLAEGETTIQNAAKEPEIIDCANLLNKMGANIKGAGTGTIRIHGKKNLHGANHTVIPDRIECGTYLIASVATKGEIVLHKAFPNHLQSLIKKLCRAGARVEVQKKSNEDFSIFCSMNKTLKPVGITTGPYPEFPTDIQAQWMALMTIADGNSSIQESIFENRYLHSAELCRMGAIIEIKEGRAAIQGVKKLSGAHVMVSDLRAGAALVIAGLISEGRTIIHRIYHLDRGYEKLEFKLQKLGAKIKRSH